MAPYRADLKLHGEHAVERAGPQQQPRQHHHCPHTLKPNQVTFFYLRFLGSVVGIFVVCMTGFCCESGIVDVDVDMEVYAVFLGVVTFKWH